MPGETVVGVQKTTVLEGQMEPEVTNILQEVAHDENLRSVSLGHAAVAIDGARAPDLHFRVNCNRGTRSFPLSATRHVCRGLLAIAAALLMVGGAQSQSVFPTSPIGTGATQTVTVTASASLTGSNTVAKVEVLTSGFSGPEFTKGTGTCDAASLSAGSQCTESVTFNPTYPGLRIGAVVLLDAGSNVLGTAYLSGTGQGGLAVLSPGNTVTVAGKYRAFESTQDGILATYANLEQPSSIAFDGAGNMYIADSAHNRIRMVCLSSTSATIGGTTCPGAGMITTIAGTGNAGDTGDTGPASASTLNLPSGIALDGAGNLYIADTSNNVVRKIAAATGIITTIAGNGTAGWAGDGQAATAAGVELNGPVGVTVDVSGNLYIADIFNQRIRRVDAVSGIITTAAGNGLPSGIGDGKGTFSGDGGAAPIAGLSLPYAVAFDGSGNMYIPDSANNLIRKVSAVNGAITAASVITTFAGTRIGGNGVCPAGPAISQNLNTPSGVALDAAGNVYIADTQDSCIRKVNATTGAISTLAMNGAAAVNAGGVVVPAQIYAPTGITVDGSGNVFYADFYNMIINEIQSNKAVLDFRATPVRQGSQSLGPLPQSVENDGNAPLSLTGIVPDTNAAVSAATTTCNLSNPLIADTACTIGAIFAPGASGNPLLGNINAANSTANTPLDIVVLGDATAVNSTTIVLVSNLDTSEFGKSAAFTATVTTGANTGNLTGTVTFTDLFNGVTVQLGAPVAVNSAGVATFATSALVVGVHTISASYSGDTTHFATETPATATQTVYEATSTIVAALPNSPSALGANVTFTATVSVTDGGALPLDGSVTFTDSVAPFTGNTVAITNGVASFTTSSPVQGVNAITATYTPNTTNLIQGSTGSVNQTVQAASALTVASSPNPATYGTSVALAVAIPTVGAAAATGKATITIVATGQATPVATQTVTLAGNPASAASSISTLAVGTYTITASYPGDTNYAPATSAGISQTITVAQTATVVSAAPNPGIAGKAVTLSAAVSVTQGTVTPLGSVTFTDTFNGAPVTLGTATVTGKGTASVSQVLAPGAHSIVATYAGDANDNSSSASLALTVNQATTSATVTAAPNPAIVNGTITFTAAVAGNGGMPTGSVNFLANGTISLGTAKLDGAGKAEITNSTLAAGSYQITVLYAGDTNDSGSASPAVTEVVGTIPTITELSTAATTGANSQSILVGTVQDKGVSGVTPTGTVTFTTDTTTIGSATLNANGVATLTPVLGTSSYNIIATYSGDALHGPSASIAIPVTGAGSSFSIGITPGTISMAASQSATVNVNLTSISGFADTISLGCVGLPPGVNCHFSNISVSLAANATQTAQLTIDTNNPLGGGASAMNEQPGKRNADLAGLFLPLSLFLGWIVWSFRKRNAGVLSAVLLLILCGSAMMATGCGGFTQTSATPGTYVVQVAGVGTNSNVTEYQTVTLTITK